MKRIIISGLVALWAPSLALAAGGITISGQEVLVASPAAKSAGAFMRIVNESSADDRLIGAKSDAAQMVQIHMSCQGADGVMKMAHLADGIALPAGAAHQLARGGDHIMLMGLKSGLTAGEEITLTLQFEKLGEVSLAVPVVSAASSTTPAVTQNCESGHSGH